MQTVPTVDLPVIQPALPPTHQPAILGSRLLRWADESDCLALAQALAPKPALRLACVELHGPLGAGKTTFVRHLLRALGVNGRIKSPTYTVMEPYTLPGLAISHFDFYRFTDPREWADAGFRDVFAAPGLKLCEWPDKAASMLPLADLKLHISVPDEDDGAEGGPREVRLEACTARGLELLP
jgi:tRNA threonylcarbamoyladenosine biosynthesis protein TsaE